MGETDSQPLVAVDVGNSRVKLGWFDPPTGDSLPTPARMLDLDVDPWDPQGAGRLLGDHMAGEATWLVASVNRAASSRVVAWIESLAPGAACQELTAGDLPISVELEAPERVGIDRLLGAVAANRLRDAGRPAIVVDLGSAIVVDLITAEGAFAGGAILPGIAMAAHALHDGTDLLPLDPTSQLDAPPPALGTSTTAAIQSGLYWGAVGAMRELVAQLSDGFDAAPNVFLTGGAAPAVAHLLGDQVSYVPHLVLAGIAVAGAVRRS